MTSAALRDAVVVLGAGHAGGRAAMALREAGHAGPITLVGEEPHPPYERPMLSKELLLGTATSPEQIAAAPAYADADVQLLTGRRCVELSRAARRLRFDDGGSLAYDRLVIATGGRPRRLPALEGQAVPVHYLRTLEDALRLRDALAEARHVLIVGGGVIGLEVAAAARQRGCTVTVVEADVRLLGRGVPASVAAWMTALHRDKGIEVHLETTVEPGPDGAGLRLSNGASVAADLVVVGIGIVPNHEFAADAGIADPLGIVVDAAGRSAAEGIYAVGDIAVQSEPGTGRQRRVETWANAEQQSVAVAQAMCGDGEGYAAVPWFWSDQFDVNLQVCGAPEAWQDMVMRGDIAARNGILFQREGETVTGAIGLNRARDMRMVKRLMTAGKTPSAEELTDESVGFRDLLR